jgi:hypothetical protein
MTTLTKKKFKEIIEANIYRTDRVGLYIMPHQLLTCQLTKRANIFRKLL